MAKLGVLALIQLAGGWGIRLDVTVLGAAVLGWLGWL